MQTQTVTVIDHTTEVDTQTGGHDKCKHIVVEGWHVLDQPDGDRTGEFRPVTPVIDSFVNGAPVIALCGKTWVANDNPGKYPLCPTCKEIAEGQGWKVPSA